MLLGGEVGGSSLCSDRMSIRRRLASSGFTHRRAGFMLCLFCAEFQAYYVFDAVRRGEEENIWERERERNS